MANIKSIGGNPIVLDASGIADGAVTPDKLAASASFDGITAGAALGITGEATDSAAWLQRVSTADGPTTIRSIHGRTLRWNQLVSDSDTSVTVPSGHKYVARIDGTTTLATSDGTAITVTGGTDNVFDLTAMFGAGSEPSTVAEFEAMYPASYYPYDAGSLLPVNMEGIETVGFNLLPSAPIFFSSSQPFNKSKCVRLSAGHEYFYGFDSIEGATSWRIGMQLYDMNGAHVDAPANSLDYGGAVTPTFGMQGFYYNTATQYFAQGSNQTARRIRFIANIDCYARFYFSHGDTGASKVMKGARCNLSGPRNGEYEAFWKSQRLIDVASYFPDGMRSAGSVYDELTSTEAITRIGERAYQSGDESDATVVTDGTITHYALTTPSTVEIDPPLNLTYRTEQGGTERVMVPTGELSAPPTIVTAQGYTAESLRDAALSAIAPIENHKASANYAIGSYLVHGGQLCKVTTAIATGEAITIGTNVVTTTVMAEVLSLTQ